jgi:hypothetical protein
MDNLNELIPLLVPVLLLQIGLMVIALKDLVGRDRTNGPRWVWAVVIIFFNIFGPIIYLLVGREE